MIAGLEQLTEGEIHIAGRKVNDLEPAERDISMVFQNYALYPHMSVRQNMSYGLKNRGQKKDEITRRVAEAARMLGLTDYLDRTPRQLSGGQRQRVAMGRAIVREPAAFLFDEPLSNLDAKLRVKTRVEIRDLQQRLATTAVYVTHDQQEAMTLADRLVVMNAGRIEQIGTPMEIYTRPATLFVAEFIGSPPMNVIPSTAAPDLAQVVKAGPDMQIGVRPEALRIAENGPLDLTVRVIERLGATSNIHGVLPDGKIEIIASLPGDTAPAPGDKVSLDCAASDLALFDARGRRVDA
jgi:sn-glycerol 3-phosphate transport system ATP-binding protein